MAVIIEKAETGAFVTNSSGMGKRNFALRQRRVPRHAGRKPYAVSMMVKIALCALSCAAALLFRLHGQNDAPMQQAMAETSETQNEDKLDEMLGRLKFVELPGILEVFAPQELMALPASGSVTAGTDDGEALCIAVSGDQYVYARLEGTVKETGESENMGRFVCITDGKTEICCYGLESVSVEEGQPIGAQDSIGSAKDGDKLTIETRRNGRPVDAAEYFRMDTQA